MVRGIGARAKPHSEHHCLREAQRHLLATGCPFLSQLGLTPIILHEQPDQGRVIVEKLEAHSDVSYAVVLVTADDEERLRASGDPLRPRARQNVVFELGYFVSKLGRGRVATLYQEGTELPSDYHGVLCIPIDPSEGWKLRLCRELSSAGLSVDTKRMPTG
jgi:predicted nucleotide-binding protein